MKKILLLLICLSVLLIITTARAEDVYNTENYKSTIEAAERGKEFWSRISGKIILRVEKAGQAYYIPPTLKRESVYLGKPDDAFTIMREQGIGILNNNLKKIPVADNYCPIYMPNCDDLDAHESNFTKAQNGKIFLQIENNGEAWYVNPINSKRYFLGRPSDAFNVMRKLGLGVSEADFISWLQ